MSTPPHTVMSSHVVVGMLTAAVAAKSTGLYQVISITSRTLANAVSVA